MKKKAVFSGTFDPFTKGHLDIVKRGLKLFDEVIIAISYNERKKTLFSIEERVSLVKESVKHLKNVSVVTHEGGLSVSLAKTLNAQFIVKGIRTSDDFKYEQLMALYGRYAEKSIETVFLLTDEKYRIVSSSGVKEFFRTGGDVSSMVDTHVIEALSKKIKVERILFNEY